MDFILDSQDLGNNEKGFTSNSNMFDKLTSTNTRTSELNENNNKTGSLNKSCSGFEIMKMAPILSILNIIRRSLLKFLLSPTDIREARSVMMKVFRNFDPQEKNKMTPRDFSFAVSVLINEIRDRDGNTMSDRNTVLSRRGQDNIESSLKFRSASPSTNVPWRMGSSISSTKESFSSSKNNLRNSKNDNRHNTNNNIRQNSSIGSNNGEFQKNKNDDPRNILCSDVPILTSDDWNSIFQFFANQSPNLNVSNQNKKNIDITIDYEKFCDLVLNQEEIKKMSSSVTSSIFKNSGKSLNKSIDMKSRKFSSHFNLDDISTAASRVRASSAHRSRIESSSKKEN